MLRVRFPWALGLSLLLGTSKANATLSILASDHESGSVGALVISCVGTEFDLSDVVQLDADVGGVVAQSHFHEAGRLSIMSNLEQGLTPEEAIAQVSNESFDTTSEGGGFPSRQYAAVNFKAEAAAFTGENNGEFSGHLTGQEGSFSFSIQGNLLTSNEALVEAKRGLVMSSGDLASRFQSALTRLLESGQGDARCSPRTADAGYVELRLSGAPVFERSVQSDSDDPAQLLLAALDEAPLSDKVEEKNRSDTQSAGCQWSSKTKQGSASWPYFLILSAAPIFSRKRRKN